MLDDDITELAKEYEDMINRRDDSDYQINPRNWEKLLTILEYFDTETKRSGGRLESVQLVPREEHGYINAIFDIFDVYGESLKAFISALKLVDVFSVEPLTNGQIRIGININNVYERKS